ncbi:MAG: CRISPR-associated endonuclease Cas2 [Candidatus Caldarchaeum sp.]
MAKLFVIVAYDIPNDRRRTRLHKKLRNFGKAVQLSVFECIITRQQFHKLRQVVNRLIDSREDHVRYYVLCPICQGRIEAVHGSISREEHTLFA